MKELTTFINAGFSALYLVSHEETRINADIRKMCKDMKYNYWSWTCTDGLTDDNGYTNDKTKDAAIAIDSIKSACKQKSIIVLKDFHLFLKTSNAIVIRKMKECIADGRNNKRHVIILGCQLHLPDELEKEITVIRCSLPSREDLLVVANAIAKSAKMEIKPEDKDKILDAGSGLTTNEFADAMSYSVVSKKAIDHTIIAKIKADTIKKNGVLEIVEVNIDLDRVGGLSNIKTWLKKRSAAFGKEAKEYGLPTPKGFLLTGLAGTGKSLIAKAAAKVLGVPLLKLDGGKIFGSLVGASESNMRSAIATAEAVSPCVLMIDELEKAMSGSKSSNSSDGGTASRVLGTFLQWMQDKTSPVFIVATANNIHDLPPELLRRGRFDQIFFVDLPTAIERKEIWNIHISRFKRKPENFDVDSLAENSDGYTGAEIESIVVDTLFSSFDEGIEPTTEAFIKETNSAIPLSRTMKEQVGEMREWAKGRAVMASEKYINTERDENERALNV